MPTRLTPRIGFRRHLRVASVPGQADIYLVSARGTVALSGDHIQDLAPLLDGSHDLPALQRRVADRISPAQVRKVLAGLARANLVGWRAEDPAAGRAGDGDPAAAAYWDLAGAAGLGQDRAPVRLEVLAGPGSTLDPAVAAAALRSAGVPLAGGAPCSGPAVVLCDDYLDPRLAELNARQLAAGRPWLLAKPTGPDLWVGPVFNLPAGDPDGGACWECLATRLRGHRRGEALLRRAGVPVAAPEASLPVTRALGLQLTALEVAKWLAGRPAGPDTVWTLDTLTLRCRSHPVRRRPQCSACGDTGQVTARMRRPVIVASAPKAAGAGDRGNGHRALTPEQVWQRYRHLVDPVSGIIESIRRDPDCPELIHSYLSGPNRAVDAGGLAASPAGLRQQSGGKGRTELEARVSALCEAVERYCGSRHGDEPTVRGSLRELGEVAIHPDRCQLFHERQYRDRTRWNRVQPEFQQIPEPFADSDQVDWSPAWSLTERRHRLLPTDLLYFAADRHPALRATSNGNAAGASVADAILQGLLELVERDAVALWWYNRTRHPAVDLSSFEDPWIADLSRAYAALGREFWVLDVSSDLGVPVFAAVSRRTDKPAEDLMFGFGAHLDPAVALRRALTELGQLLPAVAGARPDGSGYRAAEPHIRTWWRTATIANQPYLRPDERQAPRLQVDYGYVARSDLREDVDHLVGVAARHGLEVLVVDQTRPDIKMPVVKVVVPGLRHFWARFAPGRLYDVPVRLGRVAAPTPYAELNPIPLFL